MGVRGLKVHDRAQCTHYHSERDIVAIKFKCCDAFYACIDCHRELADHPVVVWGKDERQTHAILCGNCRGTLSIEEYLSCGYRCPRCRAEFNPGCADHHHFYFEV